MILDIHTHHPAPQPEGVISVSVREFNPVEGQLYSVGVHPWDVSECGQREMELLEEYAGHSQVVAIGETGIDLHHPGAAPMSRQMMVLNAHIELSERLRKPLILHEVKAHDVIMGLRKELNPAMPWVIHGFRGKPSVARMLSLPGIYFSFGERFNAETLRSIPRELILAETDDSALEIEAVIARLSEVRGEDLRDVVWRNCSGLPGLKV